MNDDFKFLAIKNWQKYQDVKDDLGHAPFIYDYVDKDSDIDRMKLSMYCTSLLDRMYRLRARYRHILHNDITWITQATHVPPRDRPHVAQAIKTLTDQNFIIPTNDENFEVSAAVEVEIEVKSRGRGRGRGRGKVEIEAATSDKPEKGNPSTSLESEEETIFGAPIPAHLCPRHRTDILKASRMASAVQYDRVQAVMTLSRECARCQENLKPKVKSAIVGFEGKEV